MYVLSFVDMYSDIIAMVKMNNSCENEKKVFLYDNSNYQVILGYNKIETAVDI